MKKIIVLAAMLFVLSIASAQYSLKLLIQQSTDHSPLPGATVSLEGIPGMSIADSMGIAAFTILPSGTYQASVSHTGFHPASMRLVLPLLNDEPVVLLLEAAEEDEEEVIITSTRSSRSISDIPTRVETISGEELAEKANMKPGDIRMMLNESTGIQTQQTSATSYNSSIRIQGLDGRYTQVLRDGFPLYAGFSGGLSLMQVTPLDLKQVEVIKGSSSTLYGGGAIAGLVNLVSRIPVEKRALDFIANATSAGGLDLSGFYSQKREGIGWTLFASRNTARAYDPAGIGFTAIPEYERTTLQPRLFFYGKKTQANVGGSFIAETRTGGSMEYIRHGTAGYFEKNKTSRFSTQFDLQHTLSTSVMLRLKNSLSFFNRRIDIPGHIFEALQRSTYSELNLSGGNKRSFWIGGLNVLTDDLSEEKQVAAVRDYHYNTFGAFIQNTFQPCPQFSLETGLRADHTTPFGWEWLPRISLMWKPRAALTTRLGGGLGYKLPTVFNEEAERLQFQNIAPIDTRTTSTERSAGSSFDVNFRTHLGALGLSVNQLFFYTRLNRPLELVTSTNGTYFENAPGHVDTRGIETNLKFSYRHFKLFIGYTYADVEAHVNNSKRTVPLNAKHRLNNVLMYEVEGNIKMGLEAYYYSSQQLTDGSQGKAYWTTGFMAEKTWHKFSLFVNFENFTDTRQTRFGAIYSGSIDHPVFRDIYAPVDGFVVNGGIKLRL